MSREVRTVLVLLVLALGGVSALAFMAYRYGKIAERGSAAGSAEIERQVEEFIVVRRAMRRAIDSWDGGARRAEDLATVRDRAMLLHGVGREAYAATRAQYRNWRAGRLDADSPVGAALESRREELGGVELGDYERFDS